jgi:hypothetical protein
MPGARWVICRLTTFDCRHFNLVAPGVGGCQWGTKIRRRRKRYLYHFFRNLPVLARTLFLLFIQSWCANKNNNMKDYVSSVNSIFNDLVDFFPPGLFLSLALSNLAGGKYFDVYVKEFIGTMLMIVFTFSAGKWIGENAWEVAWVAHAIGVVLADFIGGGQQVNPAVTMSMWALGKCDYTEAFVRVAGQMGGGLISFPLYHAISETLKWTPFGGPQFNLENSAEAAISEFTASFLLMWVIYIVSCFVWIVDCCREHNAMKKYSFTFLVYLSQS